MTDPSDADQTKPLSFHPPTAPYAAPYYDDIDAWERLQYIRDELVRDAQESGFYDVDPSIPPDRP